MNQVKQMSQILQEVNHSGPELKLVKCLAVHNEEEWVEYNMRNCYDEFDIIRVVEGAVEGRPNSTKDGHSTDRTLELVKNFPDPDNKIELYTGDRFFKSLEEQKQTFLDVANPGEWLFITDCLTGDRCVPVQIDGKTQVITLEELFEFYRESKTYSQYRFVGGHEILTVSNLKTLSVSRINYPEHKLEKGNRGAVKLSKYFRSKLTKKQLVVLDLYESGELKFNQQHNAIIRSLRKKLNELREVVLEWKDVSRLTRKPTDKNIVLTRSKHGETRTTDDHRLACEVDGQEILYTKTKFFNKTSSQDLLQASSVNQDVVGEIRLSDWIDAKRFGLFVGNDDPHHINRCLHYNSPRSDQRKFSFQDLYFGPDIEDLCWLLGYYAAVGSVDKTMANFRVCGSKEDVDRCEAILNKFGRFTSHRGMTEKHTGTEVHYLSITSSVVIQIFAELFGLGAKNKQVPGFVFHLDKYSKEAFLSGYNAGDGHTVNLIGNNKEVATTVSPKLLGGICLLNKYLGRDISLTYREPEQFNDEYDRDRTSYSCYQNVIKRRNSKSVVQINQGKTKEWVYDLVVPETHNFCDAAGMIVVHNCDEFYMDGEINRVREAIKKRPLASEIIPTFLHFYRDFFHIKAPHPEWQPQHQRIIRYRPGLRYHTHPVATDGKGRCTYFTPEYQPHRFTIPELYIFHYGHAKGKEFHEMKRKFYQSELEKFELSDGTNASQKFDEKFKEFMEYTEDLNTVLYYGDKHPTVLDKHPWRYTCDAESKYWTPFKSDKPQQYVRNEEIKNWKSNFVYSSKELPNIVLFMMGPWKKVQPFYNVIKV